MICCIVLGYAIAMALFLKRRVLLRQPSAQSLAKVDALAWRPYAVIEQVDTMPPSKPSQTTRLGSFRYALAGLRFLVQTQPNAQIHAVITVLAVLAGALLNISAADWRWVLAVTMWVWFAEAMNTAFEHVCDVVSPEFNVSVQRAKDVAAGAVLVSAAGAAALGALVFWPYVAPFIWRVATGIGICTSAA